MVAVALGSGSSEYTTVAETTWEAAFVNNSPRPMALKLSHNSALTTAAGIMLFQVGTSAPAGPQGHHLPGQLSPATLTNELPNQDVLVPPGYSVYVYVPSGGGTGLIVVGTPSRVSA